MTDKERLNTILRLRLFYSTEKELGNKVGLSLKGNHFNRQKPFVCEAFFSKFSEECKDYTDGKVNLARLLCQYETTSKFFKKYIEHTGHETNKCFIPYLLNYLYKGETPDDGAQHRKDISLCKQYDAYNQDGEMNVGIIILMTYGLIPTFKNKHCQDVTDIIGDFKKAYDILLEIALSHQYSASTKFKEILCLKAMRKLIEEAQEGDNYLNRLLLIHIANDVLDRVFALENPARIREYCKEVVPMDFQLPRLWRCEEEAANIVWEFVPLDIDAYYLYRKEIDYKAKKIRFTRYQLEFWNMGYKDFCNTVIVRPSFHWYNILKREQPVDSCSCDDTGIAYENERHNTVKELTFTKESPVGEKALVIKAVKKQDALNYYTRYLDHEGAASDFVDEDCQAQYAIGVDAVEVAVTNTAILFKGKDAIFKLDKYDKEGNETVPGISVLTHTDNFSFAVLDEDGKERMFLGLGSINQYLDVEELFGKPYFHEIEQVSDLF